MATISPHSRWVNGSLAMCQAERGAGGRAHSQSLTMDFSWQPRWWDGKRQTSGYSRNALAGSEGCGASIPTSRAVQVGSWSCSWGLCKFLTASRIPWSSSTAATNSSVYLWWIQKVLYNTAWVEVFGNWGLLCRLWQKHSESLSFIHSFNNVYWAPLYGSHCACLVGIQRWTRALSPCFPKLPWQWGDRQGTSIYTNPCSKSAFCSTGSSRWWV